MSGETVDWTDGCDAHCDGHMEEADQLRADLATSQAEIDRLNRLLAGRVTIAEEMERRREAVSRLGHELSAARAEIAALKELDGSCLEPR